MECRELSVTDTWRKDRIKARASLGVTLVFLGCWGAPTPVIPMASIHYRSPKHDRTTAVLMLPGRRSRAEDFQSNGFIDAVRDLGLDVDILAADAHLGYYLDGRYRTLPLRIEEDIVGPFVAQGGRGVWLVGTSLGAFGSLAYAKWYPEHVLGLLLLGPYLGEDPVLEEIEHTGGLAAWTPSGRAGYDYEIRSWVWLKQYAGPSTQRPFDLYIGYGLRDSLRRASDILVRILPRDHVFISEEGGHDWDTWLSLWKRFLASNGHRLEQSGVTRAISN